jgi:hypothetical protein
MPTIKADEARKAEERAAAKEKELDTPIWHAGPIALAAGLVDKRGRPRTRAAFHLLEKGLLPASKVGRSYVTTLRRLRAVANGEAV